MEDLISHYFSHLFATVGGYNIEVLDCVEKKITDDQNSVLLVPFTENDVKVALFDMHPDKSPGPDGMNSVFYQRFWNTVGEDVTNACLSFINNCSLPVGLNDTSVVLIPKKQKPEILSDMRPIALCNVLYKIVAKMLANRMKSVLGSVVSVAQRAFVPVRYHVIRNGKVIGPIVPSRGLRQGDPLSPYLFILYAEGLNFLIHKYERGHWLQESP
ncbi:hypothetical protein WN943_005845 [Citrus x changshan-huyou]